MFWGYMVQPGRQFRRCGGRRSESVRIIPNQMPNKMSPAAGRSIGALMRSGFCIVIAGFAISLPCLAQEWELGAAGGYGWYVNPSITGPSGSIQSGYASRGVMGVVFGQNMYEHVGGEVRWLYQFGGPQLKLQGIQASSTGFTNLVTYDVMFFTSHREAKVRPYVAAGAGIKVYTGNELRFVGQPFQGSAVLARATQVEPAISAGAGLKYMVSHSILLRLDFRTYFTPCPDEIFRAIGTSNIHGWVYNFVPLAGVSFVF